MSWEHRLIEREGIDGPVQHSMPIQLHIPESFAVQHHFASIVKMPHIFQQDIELNLTFRKRYRGPILFQAPIFTRSLLPDLLPVILSYLGFVAMLFSFVLMVLVAILLLFPRVSIGLKLCQH